MAENVIPAAYGPLSGEDAMLHQDLNRVPIVLALIPLLVPALFAEGEVAPVFEGISVGDDVTLILEHGAHFSGIVMKIEPTRIQLDMFKSDNGVRGYFWFPAEAVANAKVLRRSGEEVRPVPPADAESARPTDKQEVPAEDVFAEVEKGCRVEITLRHGAIFDGIVSRVSKKDISIIVSKRGMAIGELTFLRRLVAKVEVEDRGLEVPEIGAALEIAQPASLPEEQPTDKGEPSLMKAPLHPDAGQEGKATEKTFAEGAAEGEHEIPETPALTPPSPEIPEEKSEGVPEEEKTQREMGKGEGGM